MKKKLFVLWTVPLLLAGCGGSNLPDLNDAQKAQFKNTIGSLVAVPTAVSNLKSPATAVSAPTPAPGFSQRKTDSYPNVGSGDLQSRLSPYVENKTCDVEVTVPDFSSFSSGMPSVSQLRAFQLTMNVSGSGCPITMDLELHTNASSAQQFSGSFTWSYAAASYFVTATDIDAVNWKGNFSGGISGSSGNIQFNSSGTAHSGTDGEIGIYANLNASGSQGSGQATGKFGIKYANFTAEIGVKADSNGSVTYQLNGKDISQQELAQYFQGLGPSGVSGSGSSPVTPPPIPGLGGPNVLNPQETLKHLRSLS